MAIGTDSALRNGIIYSVYVRNHTEEGTFRSLEKDLGRIKSLGTDILWLMPIHPIGEVSRKGSMGCPYAIQDYRKVNPEYGTLEDFKHLLAKIHDFGMKCMIDVVYNHTSPDSYLALNHPEFFYYKNGKMGNRIGEWTDVRDLNYECEEKQKLWEYQIETLKFWAMEGVDGFRCDVASLVPVEFWIQARQEVAKVKPGAIWLAESVHLSFISEVRSEGFPAYSDGELYQAFDITYDYDVHDEYLGAIRGENRLRDYICRLELQEKIYPSNYLKLRFVENHDQPRSAKLFPELDHLKCWTAFSYFEKGTTLLYGGQEAFHKETPSLFEKDPVDWSECDSEYILFLQKLAVIKKKEILRDGFYRIGMDKKKKVVWASYRKDGNQLYGLFNLGQENGSVKIDVADGDYLNLVDQSIFRIKNGSVKLEDKPFIFETSWEI